MTDTYWYLKLVSKAELIRKREPELTEEQAIEKAADLYPEYEQAHQNEIRRGIK